jgi:ABC-type lipoprotein export system ATPase subunit
MSNFIEVTSLKKTFSSLEKPLFNNLTFNLKENSIFTGVSGSGKSSLLQILAGLDSFDDGSVKVFGNELFKINQDVLNELRKNIFGFVYQFHHLLNDFNVIDNISLPLLIKGFSKNTATIKAKKIAEYVGLKERLLHHPNQLSGGEKQRVAICRALVHNPKVIFADEPTGNLDKKNSKLIIELILDLAKENNSKVILVSHDRDILKNFKNRFQLVDGELKKC